jgi:hypothetical protein
MYSLIILYPQIWTVALTGTSWLIKNRAAHEYIAATSIAIGGSCLTHTRSEYGGPRQSARNNGPRSVESRIEASRVVLTAAVASDWRFGRKMLALLDLTVFVCEAWHATGNNYGYSCDKHFNHSLHVNICFQTPWLSLSSRPPGVLTLLVVLIYKF